MVLLIPYSHKDAAQALRLLKWIRFLETMQRTSLARSPISIYMVASQQASKMVVHLQIAEELTHFPDARQIVLLEEYEHGWPGACNFMFFKALSILHGKDVMLLEPDAIPLTQNWWDVIQEEWDDREKGQEFMGNRVPENVYAVPHMTGNAVYGKKWPKLAPKIAEVQDRTGWDVHAADQILPRAKITPLIQHEWKPSQVSLALLSPDAVVFHQDKSGNLIALLDQEYYGCEADRMTGYSSVQNDAKIMKRFFYSPSANRAFQANGLNFEFEITEQFAGHWQGVFSTEVESEAMALAALASSGLIKEINEAEFLEQLDSKKKVQPSQRLVEPSGQQATSIQAKIETAPALLVEDPVKAGIHPAPADELKVPLMRRVANALDVLKIAKVTPSETPKKKPTTKKGKS